MQWNKFKSNKSLLQKGISTEAIEQILQMTSLRKQTKKVHFFAESVRSKRFVNKF